MVRDPSGVHWRGSHPKTVRERERFLEHGAYRIDRGGARRSHRRRLAAARRCRRAARYIEIVTRSGASEAEGRPLGGFFTSGTDMDGRPPDVWKETRSVTPHKNAAASGRLACSRPSRGTDGRAPALARTRAPCAPRPRACGQPLGSAPPTRDDLARARAGRTESSERSRAVPSRPEPSRAVPSGPEPCPNGLDAKVRRAGARDHSLGR